MPSILLLLTCSYIGVLFSPRIEQELIGYNLYRALAQCGSVNLDIPLMHEG